MIKLDELLNRLVDEITIDDVYSFDNSYLDSGDIKALNGVKLNSIIYIDTDELLAIKGAVTGEMTLVDAVSLEQIKHPFFIEFDDKLDENFIKNENMLDIMEFLWQNIVLEVPLRVTEVTDFSKFNGDGWKLISEEELSKNNPFGALLKDEEKE